MVYVQENTLSKTGLFHDIPSINVGAPYEDTAKRSYLKGRNIIAVKPPGLFDDTVRPLQTTEFIDQAKLERMIQSRGGPIKDKPAFLPGSMTAATLADLYKGLGPPRGGTGPEQAEGGRKVQPKLLRNLYTSPAKLGGPGYPLADRTIGGKVEEHMADEFQPGMRLTREERIAARAKIQKPFVTAGKVALAPPTFLSATTNAASRAARASAAMSSSNADEDEGKRKVESKSTRPPFRPTNPPKRGNAYSLLSNVGRDYVPDPIREPERVRDANKPVAFKPTGSSHSKFTRDINPYLCPPIPPLPAFMDTS